MAVNNFSARAQFEPRGCTYTASFENGIPPYFTTSPNAFTQSSDTAYDGTYSVKSANITQDGDSSWIKYTNTPRDGYLSFYYDNILNFSFEANIYVDGFYYDFISNNTSGFIRYLDEDKISAGSSIDIGIELYDDSPSGTDRSYVDFFVFTYDPYWVSAKANIFDTNFNISSKASFVRKDVTPSNNNGLLISNNSTSLTVGDNAILDGAGKFSFAFSFYATNIASPDGILSKRVGSNNQQAYSFFTDWNGATQLLVDINGSSNRFGVTIDENRWYRAVVVFDGALASAERIKLYLNGVLRFTKSTSDTTIPDYSSSLFVGTLNASYGSSFKGHIDEIQIFKNIALTEQEVIDYSFFGDSGQTPTTEYTFIDLTDNQGSLDLSGSNYTLANFGVPVGVVAKANITPLKKIYTKASFQINNIQSDISSKASIVVSNIHQMSSLANIGPTIFYNIEYSFSAKANIQKDLTSTYLLGSESGDSWTYFQLADFFDGASQSFVFNSITANSFKLSKVKTILRSKNIAYSPGVGQVRCRIFQDSIDTYYNNDDLTYYVGEAYSTVDYSQINVEPSFSIVYFYFSNLVLEANRTYHILFEGVEDIGRLQIFTQSTNPYPDGVFSRRQDSVDGYEVFDDYDAYFATFQEEIYNNATISAKASITNNIKRKTFAYKIYDGDTQAYVTSWISDVLSTPKFKTVINGGASDITIKLNRTFDNFGEDIDVKINNRVELYCFDRDNPSGILIYKGFISGYRPVLNKNTEYVEVTVLPYISQMSWLMYESGTSTTVTQNSKDPTDIFKDIIDKYNTHSNAIFYTLSSVDDTSTTVSYTFKVNTIKEAIDNSIGLTPENWYYRIDPDGTFVLKESDLINADHTFLIGKEISQMDTWRRAEDIVNKVYFLGGDTGGENYLYRVYENQSSIDAYGLHAIKLSDERVTNNTTADIVANRQINLRSEPEIRTTVTILDNNGDNASFGYDIESIRPGQTMKIKNINQGIAGVTHWDQAIWDVDVWDETLTYTAASTIQIQAVSYEANFVVIEASSRSPIIAKRIEDIQRNIDTWRAQFYPASPVVA